VACCRGPKGELPQGGDGSYGSSLPITKVMDPASDILVAYRQNGELLMPDHGYPVNAATPD
jgi:nitrate reductase (NAD(P)H)